MARVRDYRQEYRRRVERARQSGFRSYREQRMARAVARQQYAEAATAPPELRDRYAKAVIIQRRFPAFDALLLEYVRRGMLSLSERFEILWRYFDMLRRYPQFYGHGYREIADPAQQPGALVASDDRAFWYDWLRARLGDEWYRVIRWLYVERR